jgi:hypothetical protein
LSLSFTFDAASALNEETVRTREHGTARALHPLPFGVIFLLPQLEQFFFRTLFIIPVLSRAN